MALVAYFLLPLDAFGPHRPVLSWTSFGVALGVVTALLLSSIRAALPGRPGTRPGLTIPVLIGLVILVFSAGYLSLAKQPGAFHGLDTRLDALYFTLVTLATVGYGDVVPGSQSARFVTLLQIGYNFVFFSAAASAVSRYLKRQFGRRARGGGHGS